MHFSWIKHIRMDWKPMRQAGWMSILLFAVSCSKMPSTGQRMAILPVSMEESEAVVLADRLSETLHHQLSPGRLVYPLRWMSGTLCPDSLYSLSYLAGYAKTVKLDRIYRVQKIGSDQFLVTRISMSNPSQTDTLILDKQPNEIDLPLSFWSDDSDHHVFSVPIPKQVAGYGQILSAQWNGDYSEAARIAMNMPDTNDLEIRIKQIETLLDEGLARQSSYKSGEAQTIQCHSLLESMDEKDRSSAYVQYLEGRLALQEKHWNFAALHLKNALSADPTLSEAYLLLSKLDASRLDHSICRNAADCLKRALFYNPASAESRVAFAERCQRFGKTKRTEQIYQTLIDFRPDRTDYYFNLGNYYLSRGDLIKMISVYERLILLNSNCSEAFYNLGIAYYNQKDEENSERFFKKAVEIDNHADSHFYLAKISLDREDFTEAARQFQERVALRKGPVDPYADEARKQIAILRAEINQPES